jgi:hypothetical protein
MTRADTALAIMLACGLATAPVCAEAKTPTPEARNAGQVQELALMLNSVALRCKTIGIDLQPQFASFAARQKPALLRAEEALKRHFGVAVAADLNGEFDRFFIKIYNFYGTGRTDQQSCGSFGKLMDTLAQADADGGLLTKIAEIMVPEPILDSHQ